MRIEMLQSIRGAADAMGNTTRLYSCGHIYEMTEAWQIDLAGRLIDEDWARDLDRKALGGAPENKALDGAPENKVLHTVKRPRGRPRKTVVMEG